MDSRTTACEIGLLNKEFLEEFCSLRDFLPITQKANNKLFATELSFSRIW